MKDGTLQLIGCWHRHTVATVACIQSQLIQIISRHCIVVPVLRNVLLIASLSNTPCVPNKTQSQNSKKFSCACNSIGAYNAVVSLSGPHKNRGRQAELSNKQKRRKKKVAKQGN
jgi:hypothetical protein